MFNPFFQQNERAMPAMPVGPNSLSFWAARNSFTLLIYIYVYLHVSLDLCRILLLREDKYQSARSLEVRQPPHTFAHALKRRARQRFARLRRARRWRNIRVKP